MESFHVIWRRAQQNNEFSNWQSASFKVTCFEKLGNLHQITPNLEVTLANKYSTSKQKLKVN
jgi:hypothetical protein